MEGLEDLLYRIGKMLISPREAFYVHTVEKHPVSFPLSIYVILSFTISSLLAKVSFALLGLPTFVPSFPLEVLSELFGIIGVAFSISFLILYATTIHLIARILRYTIGSWEEVLCAVAYSVIPQSLTAFLLALSYLFSSCELLLVSIAFLSLGFTWSAYILTEEVSLVYDLSMGRSLLISLVVPLSIIALSVLLFALMGLLGLAVVVAPLVALYYWREVG